MAIGLSLLSACVGGSEPASTVTLAAKIVTPAPTSAKGSATVGVAGTRTRIATPYTSPIIASPVAASPVMASPATAKASPVSTVPVNVAIVLTDYRISAFQRSFRVGQPYRFVVENNGAVMHQFVIEARGGDRRAPLVGGRDRAARDDRARHDRGIDVDVRKPRRRPVRLLRGRRRETRHGAGDCQRRPVVTDVQLPRT